MARSTPRNALVPANVLEMRRISSMIRGSSSCAVMSAHKSPLQWPRWDTVVSFPDGSQSVNRAGLQLDFPVRTQDNAVVRCLRKHYRSEHSLTAVDEDFHGGTIDEYPQRYVVAAPDQRDRKSTRLNSSHSQI